MQRSNEIDQLAAALAEAATEFPAIDRGCTAKVQTRNGGSYSYSYADLNDVLSAVRLPLAKNGLTLSHDCRVIRETVTANDGEETFIFSVETVAILEHKSGQWKQSSPFLVQCDGSMAAAQLVGSGSTYGKRYTAQNILGLSTEADDDGNAAAGNDATTGKRQALPPCPKCGVNKSVIVGKAEYGGGYVCFGKKDGCGHKWKDPPEPPKETVDPEVAKYLAEANAAIIEANSLEELKALGEIIKTKPEVVQNALRSLFQSRWAIVKGAV